MLNNVVTSSKNAVAPDWNLKYTGASHRFRRLKNAVAPDWNLKQIIVTFDVDGGEMQSHQIGI